MLTDRHDPGMPAKVLVVEDSRLQAEIAVHLLQRHGYRAEVARSPEEALRAVAGPAPPDLVLMDIDLGAGLDGTDLARIIQEQYDIPVVFLTALSSKRATEKARAATRYGYVLKGAPEHVIAAAVGAALELHRALSTAETFQKLFEEAISPMCLFEAESLALLAASHGLVRLLGYGQEELEGLTVPEVLPEIDPGELRETMLYPNRCPDGSLSRETVARAKDGSFRPVQVTFQCLRRARRGTCAALIIDLTERKRFEAVLEEHNRFLSQVLSAVPAGILVIDAASHQVEEINAEALSLLGLKREEALGRPCWEVLRHPPGECPAAGSENWRSERVLTRRDGAKVPVLNTTRHLTGQRGDKVIEVIVDITDRKRLEEALYQMSVTDGLTQAYNRRYLLEMLRREILRSRRSGRPFALIMFDLDHFKAVNDRFGHAAGDRVLKTTVSLFKDRLRATDCLARWGGEEFAVLLPETDLAGGMKLAEELRKLLSETLIPGVGRVTASFGVAAYRRGDSPDDVATRADTALYRAKAEGRNRVCGEEPEGRSTQEATP